MNDEARFEATDELEQHGDVRVFLGRDRWTGMQVRIFRFRGVARGAPTRVDHRNLPGVLALDADDEGTQLVNFAPSGFVPLHDTSLSADQVQAAADALSALHAAEIVHGGLGPRRLRVSRDDGLLVLEGGGVPWTRQDGREPTARDDVRALASMLLAKGRNLPKAVAKVLEDAAVGSGADDGVALSVALDAAAHANDTDEEPVVSAAHEPDAPATDTPSLVKDLPPGGVYRSGDTRPRTFKPAPIDDGPEADEAPRRTPWPRPPFVLALVAAIVIAIAFAIRGREPALDPVEAQTSYVVQIVVEPADSPPLELFVVDAPSGSNLTSGSGLGRAPRRVQLDRPGRWILEGRFAGQVSEPVSFVVPGTTRATVRLGGALDDPSPDAPAGSEPAP